MCVHVDADSTLLRLSDGHLAVCRERNTIDMRYCLIILCHTHVI